MRFLKTNTATRVSVGPFLDKTDGITPEVALTVTSCKLTFMVDDGGVPTLVLDVAPTASGGANDMVHVTGDDAGFYDLELAAANVNYVGRAMLAITDVATHCPVFHEFMILPANIYDSFVGGTDVLDVSVTQWLGTAAATPTVAGVPEVDATHWNGTAVATPTVAGVPEVDATHWNGTAVATPDVAGMPKVTSNTLRGNTAQAGAAGTITLDAAASATNDLYNGCVVAIISGSGAGQARQVTDYVGATKVASVAPNWTTNPSNDSVFVILPFADLLNEVMTESYAADGAAFTVAQALFEIAQSIGEFAIAGTTITMKKRDGAATAGTYTLDSATAPTSRTRAS